MEDVLFTIKLSFACAGGFLVGLLGGWDLALKILVLFVVLDYVTGLIVAVMEKKLNSDVGFKGITRKILLFVPIIIAYYLDNLTGHAVLRSIAILFYIVNEGLSILENLVRAGVPVPGQVRDTLEALKSGDKAVKAGG